jgi:hypothetical protein
MITEGLKGRDFITLRDFSRKWPSTRRGAIAGREAWGPRSTPPCAARGRDAITANVLQLEQAVAGEARIHIVTSRRLPLKTRPGDGRLSIRARARTTSRSSRRARVVE